MALANELGLSERHTANLLAKGMPGAPGHYVVEDARAWYEADCAKRGKPATDDGETNGHAHERQQTANQRYALELRKLEAEVRARELRTELLAGRLVDSAKAQQQFALLVSFVKSRLENVPDRVAADAPGELRDIERERVAEIIHVILTELSQASLDDA